MRIDTLKARLGLPETPGATFTARWRGEATLGLLSTEDGILMGDVTFHAAGGTETLSSIRGVLIGDRFDIEDDLAAADFCAAVAGLTLDDYTELT